MHIRKADNRQNNSVRGLYLATFSVDERDVVADLAVNLLVERTNPETLALVAETDDRLVGHISFSPVTLTATGAYLGYILSPLAVHPEFQQQGIGTQLIESGLKHLSSLGAKIVFVYGDPKYYGRFGFEADAATAFTPPYPLQYDFGWQAKHLTEQKDSPSSGRVTCVPTLMDPQLW